MKTVLIVAGSDPGAGAGLQQDLKTATLLGAYGLTVVTALTVQNSLGVKAVHPVPPEVVAAQWDAVVNDFPVQAVKLGMLGTAANARVVARGLWDLRNQMSQGSSTRGIPAVVLDPVLAAGRGEALLDEEGLEVLTRDLFPLATVVTPNVPEAARLTGLEIDTPNRLEEAARRLQALGPAWVLAKGGHLPGDPVDILTDGKNLWRLPGTRLAAPHHHGSGCLLATALAAHLAQGLSVPEAVNRARRLVTTALRYGLPLGQGVGPVNPYAAFAKELARYEVLEELRRAADRLVREDLSPLVPEEMSNLAYALPFAEGPEDVAAFPGRLIKTPQGLLVPTPPAFGAPLALARLLLAAMAHRPGLRAALNLRYFPGVEGIAPLLHFFLARIGGPLPTVEAEWGKYTWEAQEIGEIFQVMKASEPAPDLLLCPREDRTEPLMLVLGENPASVAEKALALKNAWQTAKILVSKE